MCDPATAITVASTVGGLFNAKQESDQSKKAYEMAKKGAEDNALRQYSALQARQEQESAKATQSITRSYNAARAASSAATVSSGEAGVGGNSVTALHNEFARTAAEYEGSVTRNKAFLDNEFKNEALSVRLGAQAEINRNYNQIQQPNYLGILLQGAGKVFEIKAQKDALNPVELGLTGTSAGAVDGSAFDRNGNPYG